MSFLDRLKREADQQRAQAETVARERDERDARYLGHIEPRMKALTAYLEGLAETLREVKPPIVVAMSIPGYGELAGVPVWDYKVEHERRYRSFMLEMTWTLRVDAERSPEVRAEGPGRVQTLTALFRQHHLGGIKEVQRTPKGELSIALFHARGYIKARMQAQITAEDPVLRTNFENANWLGTSRRQLAWHEIDDSLFDRIARFIVREDDSLFTEELPEALRQKLRKDPEPARGPLPGEVLAQAAAPATSKPTTTPAPPPVAAPAAPVMRNQPVARPSETAAPSPSDSAPARSTGIPGTIPAPAPVEAGEVIQIDESRLGLWGDPDAPLKGLDREGDFARQAKLANSGVSASAPQASPLVEGGMIPIDESKLGLHNFKATDEFSSVARTLPASPTPTPKTAAVPPPTPSAPAPAGSELRPPVPAATPAKATPPSSPTPVQAAAAAPAMLPAPSTPAAPAVAPAASKAAESEGDQDRDAALFRLRMRAMMARLRSDEPGDDKAG